MIICLYVDDLLVTGSCEKEISGFKERMTSEFEMTYLSHLSYFLRMELKRTSEGVILHQSKYAANLLKRFHMQHCNSAATLADPGILLQKEGSDEAVDPTYYRKIVRSLRYLCNSRPDLVFSVGLISRFMDNLRVAHLMATKRIMRYAMGTLNYGILFSNRVINEENTEIYGYTDSDWCEDKGDRKSITCHIFSCLLDHQYHGDQRKRQW